MVEAMTDTPPVENCCTSFTVELHWELRSCDWSRVLRGALSECWSFPIPLLTLAAGEYRVPCGARSEGGIYAAPGFAGPCHPKVVKSSLQIRHSVRMQRRIRRRPLAAESVLNELSLQHIYGAESTSEEADADDGISGNFTVWSPAFRQRGNSLCYWKSGSEIDWEWNKSTH